MSQSTSSVCSPIPDVSPDASQGNGGLLTRVQELEQRVKELSALLDVASQVAGPVELPEVLGALLTSAAIALDLQVCFVALVSPGSEHATVAASWVRDRSPQLALKNTPIRLADYPLAQLSLINGKPLHVRSLEDTRLTDVDRKNMVQTGCSSALAVPAKVGDEVVALLAFSWGGKRDIAAEGQHLAEAVAAHAALAIQRARLYSQEQDARHWLSLVLDAVPAAVYCLDSERRIRWLSRAAREMAGVGPSLPEGTHCYDLVELWDAKGNSVCQGRCPAQESFRKRQTIHCDDLHLTRADGRLVPVSMTTAFAQSASGEPLVIGITIDESHRRATDELRDGLVSTVSHEFRTPLQIIKGFATTLLRQDVEWDAETRQEALESIDRETDRLAVLVSNVLDLSRLEAGHPIFSQQAYCDPIELAHTALKRAGPLVQDHPVDVQLPSRVKPLFVESDELQRVLVNLLENAAKFSQKGQSITLAVRNRKHGVEFHVQDRGRGISQEDQGRLFERFSRARSAGDVRGAGLGLAICKAFVERNGGRIWLERSTVGKGSDFAFWIPSGERNPDGRQ